MQRNDGAQTGGGIMARHDTFMSIEGRVIEHKQLVTQVDWGSIAGR